MLGDVLGFSFSDQVRKHSYQTLNIYFFYLSDNVLKMIAHTNLVMALILNVHFIC